MILLTQGARPALAIQGLTFHHVGIACRDLDEEEHAYAALGYVRESPDFYDPLQGVHGRFLVGGGPRLELLRNHEDPGVLTPWLKKGVRFYHLAYETDDFALRTASLKEMGAKEVVPPRPAAAFDGRLITFFMLANLTMIELISTT
jgi:methylmalonyl-CoA/ethylmalonyl-CoA epimerase